MVLVIFFHICNVANSLAKIHYNDISYDVPCNGLEKLIVSIQVSLSLRDALLIPIESHKLPVVSLDEREATLEPPAAKYRASGTDCESPFSPVVFT